MKILISIIKMLPFIALFAFSAYHGLTCLYFRAFEGIYPTGLIYTVNGLFWGILIMIGVLAVILYSLDHTINVINKILNN